MRIVVPLAGPDFVTASGELKARSLVNGAPLLLGTLKARTWASHVQSKDYSFVMIDRPETRDFANAELSDWYPDASVVFLSNYTRGAALTSIAGLSTVVDPAAAVTIDLADIQYRSNFDPVDYFANNPMCGGVALTFRSAEPHYSYLDFDEQGIFRVAAEKRVISVHASAGTYFFRSAAIYLRAMSHALQDDPQGHHMGNFFVCPVLNGVKKSGMQVHAVPVTDVFDIKKEGA